MYTIVIRQFLKNCVTYLFLLLQKKAVGQHLMEQIFYHLDIIEKDYFGLQYTDPHNVPHWLDPSKLVKKQNKIGPPYTFRMRIKFYSSEPNNLHEELTRYQFFLQLKQDLLCQRLECPYETSVQLASYSLQCKYLCFTMMIVFVDSKSLFSSRAWWLWPRGSHSIIRLWVSIRCQSKRTVRDWRAGSVQETQGHVAGPIGVTLSQQGQELGDVRGWYAHRSGQRRIWIQPRADTDWNPGFRRRNEDRSLLLAQNN